MDAQNARAIEHTIASQVGTKKSRRAWVMAFGKKLRSRAVFYGWAVSRAEYDAAGDCTACGEAGRCYGWHIITPEA